MFRYPDPFILHMLMDGNIASSLGNTREYTLRNFYNFLSKDNFFVNILHFFSPENIKIFHDSYLININNDNSKNLPLEPINIELDIYRNFNKIIKEYADIFKKNEDINYELNIFINKVESIVYYYRDIIKYCYSIVTSKDELFIPSGWSDNISGHIIGIYYKKINDDDYDLILTNSGDGLINHYGRDSKYLVINKIKNVRLEQIIKIMIMSIRGYTGTRNNFNFKDLKGDDSDYYLDNFVKNLLNEFSSCGITNIDNSEDYYHQFSLIFECNNFSEINIELNPNYLFEAQLSGSCSFYGIYYFIYYYYSLDLELLQKFENIYNKLKTEVAINIITTLTESENITDEIYNVINLLSSKYLTNYNHHNIDLKYKTNVMKIINYSQDYKLIFYENYNNIKTINVQNILLELDNCGNISDYIILLIKLKISEIVNIKFLKSLDRYNNTFFKLITTLYDNIFLQYIINGSNKENSFYMLNSNIVEEYFLNFSYLVNIIEKNEYFILLLNMFMMSILRYKLIPPIDRINIYLGISNIYFKLPCYIDNCIDYISKFMSYLPNDNYNEYEYEYIKKWNFDHNVTNYNFKKILLIIFSTHKLAHLFRFKIDYISPTLIQYIYIKKNNINSNSVNIKSLTYIIAHTKLIVSSKKLSIYYQLNVTESLILLPSDYIFIKLDNQHTDFDYELIEYQNIIKLFHLNFSNLINPYLEFKDSNIQVLKKNDTYVNVQKMINITNTSILNSEYIVEAINNNRLDLLNNITNVSELLSDFVGTFKKETFITPNTVDFINNRVHIFISNFQNITNMNNLYELNDNKIFLEILFILAILKNITEKNETIFDKEKFFIKKNIEQRIISINNSVDKLKEYYLNGFNIILFFIDEDVKKIQNISDIFFNNKSDKYPLINLLLYTYFLKEKILLDLFFGINKSYTYTYLCKQYKNVNTIYTQKYSYYICNDQKYLDNIYINLPNYMLSKKYLFKIISMSDDIIAVENEPSDNTNYMILLDNNMKIIKCIKNHNYLLINEIILNNTNQILINFLNTIIKFTKKFVCYNDTNESYITIIDFPSYFKQNNNSLTIYYKYNNLYIFYDNIEYIFDSNNFIHQRYVYGIDNAFIIKNGTNYKILLINSEKKIFKNMLKAYFLSHWINNKKNNLIIKKIISNYSESEYYIIDIHYTGLFLNFPSAMAYLSYFASANATQKNDIIDMLYSFGQKYQDHKNIMILLKYPNTPYNYYYKLKLSNIQNKLDYNKYDNLKEKCIMRSNYYPKKYLMYTITRFSDDSAKDIQFKKYSIVKKIIKNMDNDIDFSKLKDDIKIYVEKYTQIEKDEKYNGKYVRCYFDDKVLNKIRQTILKCSQNIEKKIESIYQMMGQKYIREDIYTNLIKNSNLFYGLLYLYRLKEICNNINLIICDEHCCNRTLLLVSAIDEYYIYTKERNPTTILFELLFGHLIRDDQYKIYNNIISEIAKKKKYNIYQMLMGKGKTSVILPLLIFKYLFIDDFYNLVIVLPKHLINQTYDAFIDKYIYIMDFVCIKKIEVTRYTDLTIIKKIFTFNEGIKNLIIIDIASLQSCYLNFIEHEHNNINIFDTDKTIFIFDEIDSLSDPLSNELNYPLKPRENYHLQYDIINQLVYFSRFILENYGTPITDLYSLNNFIDSTRTDSYNLTPKEKYINNKIKLVLQTAFTKIHNKDYGFDPTSNKRLAIPFNGVNNPVIGSDFSDLEIKIVFTCLNYFISGLRDYDIQIIKKILESILNKNNDIQSLVNKKIFKFLKINVSTLTLLDIHKITIDKYDKNIIFYYLKKYILPEDIKNYSNQYNCSFIDVAGNKFSKFKIGFSGTIDSIHIDILKMDIAKFQNNIFYGIIKDENSIGAMYSAVLGMTQKNLSQIIKLNPYKSDDDLLMNIIEILMNGNYDALIDTGAVLRNFNSEKVINTIMTKYQKHMSYIYINSDNKICIINSPNNKSKKMFIYYDQKHTIGIDIPDQPYLMKGLVTVNYFNNFTNVIQGIYRLRKINYGHSVDFLTINLEDFKNVEKLLEFLNLNDKKYKNSTLSRASLQQIKYLTKINNNIDPLVHTKTYKEDIFYEIDYINENSDLNKNILKKYIKLHYYPEKDSEYFEIIKNLCQQVNDTNNNLMDQNIEEQISISEEINKNIEKKIILNNNSLKNQLYFNRNNWIIQYYYHPKVWDFKNISTNKIIDKIINEYFIKNNIYVSLSIFQMNDYLYYDILGNRKSAIKYEDIIYNYYYIVNNEKVLIIKGWEKIIIENQKLINNDKMNIFNKNCTLIMGINNNQIKSKSLIKYILGGDVSIVDIFQVIYILVQDNYNYNNIFLFLEIIKYYFLTIFNNDSLYRLLNVMENNKIDNFLEFISNIDIKILKKYIFTTYTKKTIYKAINNFIKTIK